MSDARDLMAVHPDDRDRDWLKKALACAITLEHSTIPPYLCALWSIKSRASLIRKQILQVVVEEEMGHMALASNMLVALGDVPPIGDPGFVPSYPTPLPCGIRPIHKPDLIVGLEGFSVPLVRDVFMNIEAPDTDPVPILATHARALGAAKDEGPTYPSIGEFYAAIRAAFEALGTTVTFPTPNQITYQFLSDPINKVFPIANVADALQAIDQIREQGEGTPKSPTAAMTGKELAHYYQFEQIPRGKMFIQDGSGTWVEGPDLPLPPPATLYPMAPVPKGGYVNPPAEVVAALKDFNDEYQAMLVDLKATWGQGGTTSLNSAISRMRNLEGKADAIFQFKIGSGPAVYGPTFEV